MTARSLEQFPIHLGRGGRAEPQPEMDGEEWFEAYGMRTASDGADGRLVSQFAFHEPWTSWEMHPEGDEVVMCLEGRFTLHQELADGSRCSVELVPGDYAVNPPGAWHTADTVERAVALFITAGAGTVHRPR